jgi:hypothetical protein
MGLPDFNNLYGPGRDLSPRMAYRVWWLAHALHAEDAQDFQRRMPHVVSLTATPHSSFWEFLRARLEFLIEHVADGRPENAMSRCTGDDVLLHIILSRVEEGLLTGGDEVVGGDSQFAQFHAHQIDDCAQAYRSLVRYSEIWRIWDLGNDELLDRNWFTAHHVPLWEPSRWFDPHQR